MKLRTPMPHFEGATDWLKGGPLSPADLEGHITVVHFWAVSCGVCKPHLPILAEWARKYEDQGVRFLSVHMPRQESDTNVEDVMKLVELHGLGQPTAVDSQHEITDRFGNEYVPAYYVFDRTGVLRLYMSGEKVLPQVEATIERLLHEPTTDAPTP